MTLLRGVNYILVEGRQKVNRGLNKIISDNEKQYLKKKKPGDVMSTGIEVTLRFGAQGRPYWGEGREETHLSGT